LSTTTIPEFLGNKEIQQFFNTLIEKGNFHHAYLFYGIEGVGKKTFALKIAKKLVEQNIVDIKIIEKNNDQIYISDIRELKEFLSLTSFTSYKIAIIDDIHKLNKEAANALLKILEEPGKNSIIFLITHSPKILLPTILSRCQLIRFKPISSEEIYQHLLMKKVDKDLAQSICKLANGSFGRAMKFLEDFEKFKANVRYLFKLQKLDLYDRFDFSKKMSVDLDGLRNLVRDWLVYLDLLIKDNINIAKLAKNALNLYYKLYQSNLNHQLAFEAFILEELRF